MSTHERAALFARVDALPAEYRAGILKDVDRLLRGFEYMAGVELRRAPPARVLRLVPAGPTQPKPPREG